MGIYEAFVSLFTLPISDRSAKNAYYVTVRNTIAEYNMGFVANCSKKYGRNREDLMQAGFLGLLDAVDKFQPEKGFPFLSFAKWDINNRMMEELNSQRPVKTPLEVARRARKVRKYAEEHSVSLSEAMDALQIPEKKRPRIYAALRMVQSVSASNEGDTDITAREVDENDYTPEQSMFIRENLHRLPNAFRILLEKRIEGQSKTKIAREHQLSPATIVKLENDAVQYLKSLV